MADKYQTQCPHCGVKFQISAQQLSLAGGNVRCGSCLQVFQASQNLVPLAGGTPAAAGPVGSARATGNPPPRPATPAAPAAPSARPSAQAPARPAAPPPSARPPAAPTPPRATTPPPRAPLPPPIEDDDFSDIEDLLATQARPAIPVPPPAAPRKPAAPPPELDDSVDEDLADMILREAESTPPSPPPARPAAGAPPATPARPVAPPPSDEPVWTPPQAERAPRWTTGEDEPEPEPESSAKRYGIEENATKISIGDGQVDGALVEETDDLFGGGASTYQDKIEEPVDENWAKELIGEAPEDEKEKRVRQFREVKADKLSLADTTGTRQKSELESRLDRGAKRPADDLGIDDELDFLSNDGLTMQDVELPGIDPADELGSVPLSHQVQWGRELFWGTLSGVFLLVLFGQYLAFNSDTLARDDDWRGLYEVVCGAVGCTVPAESDIGRIQGANLIVRSHPRVEHALIVDAIVYNRAEFAQPFPDLELVFSDRNGQTMAGRVFKPAEYLAGEISADDWMPPGTPIHISLELADPGEGAVNYEMRFLEPRA